MLEEHNGSTPADKKGTEGSSTWDSSFVPKCPAAPIEMSEEDKKEKETFPPYAQHSRSHPQLTIDRGRELTDPLFTLSFKKRKKRWEG
jgi:hypothetical protein